MEALEALSEGDSGVRTVGVGEYAEQFFDVISDDMPWHWRVVVLHDGGGRGSRPSAAAVERGLRGNTSD